MKKILNILKQVIITLLGVSFFGFSLLMTILLLTFNEFGVSQFGNTNLVIIKNEINNEKYIKNDLVFVNKTSVDKINVGDEIFVYKLDSKRVPFIEVGKIGNVYKEEKTIEMENGEAFSEEFIVGTATKRYAKIGGLLSVVESKWGFLFIVLIPSFLIFIYIIYTLILEIKYGATKD